MFSALNHILFIFDAFVVTIQCSLLGMLVIILGLYLFLWGGSKEKITASILPKSYVNEEKSSKISDQTVVVQSTATVVPTASPVSHGSDHHDRV